MGEILKSGQANMPPIQAMVNLEGAKPTVCQNPDCKSIFFTQVYRLMRPLTLMNPGVNQIERVVLPVSEWLCVGCGWVLDQALFIKGREKADVEKDSG